MATFQAKFPPAQFSASTHANPTPCVHEFLDGGAVEVPDDHAHCLKMLRRSAAFVEV